MKLRAGDAVVYSNVCFHWGSAYNRLPIRRTLHLSYRAIGSGTQRLLSKSHSAPGLEEPSFVAAVPSDCARHFRRMAALLAEERATMAALFHAVIARDESAFERALVLLHVGTEHRMVAVVLLSKIVKAVGLLCSPEIVSLPEHEREAALAASPDWEGSPDWPVCKALAGFTSSEGAAILVHRFATVSTHLSLT